ncbi:unnamed protein product [Closterium sp. NIES-65]|nr:unnamed protein product [Closterium sp. NIES-65]
MPPGQSIDATWLAYLADFCCLGSLRLDNCRYVTDSALSMLSGILEMLSQVLLQVLTQLHVVGCVFMFDVHALEHLSLTNCPLLTASFLATILLPCLPALLATIMLWPPIPSLLVPCSLPRPISSLAPFLSTAHPPFAYVLPFLPSFPSFSTQRPLISPLFVMVPP